MISTVKRIYLSDRLPIYVITVGAFLRIYQYLYCKSLWIDEAALALNIINRPFSGLIEHLDYNQYAPLGFLFVEKAITLVFGNSEYSLRLFPLICGLISLPLFYSLSKKVLKKESVPVALIIFITTWSLLYYSVEAKQYACDVMATMLLYLALLYAEKKEYDLKTSLVLALLGSIMIWFSHPLIFVMAGAGTTLIIFSIWEREWKKLYAVIPILLFWLLSFAADYFSFSTVKNEMDKKWLFGYWSIHFAPFPITSASDLMWYYEHFVSIFKNKLMLGMYPLSGFWIVFFLIGTFSLFHRNKKLILFMIMPFFFTLAASALKLYPFYERLLLFLIPIPILLISEGIVETLKRCAKSRVATAIMALLLVTLLICSFVKKGNYLFIPIQREEIRPVLNYMKAHWEPGDVIYTYHGAIHQFLYYAPRYGFDDEPVYSDSLIRKNPYIYSFELNRIRGEKRVWVIFSHIYREETIEEMKRSYLDRLDKAGRRVDSFNSVASSVFLYDLSADK
ncbi:MAG: glycosyltransferase family 39 protein [Deltaproteobacteria bacterium]|uniref:Glycosyltransferase family 39 protein n=1 Tax=Candidatus Zymogenus saltonus TaxID=2844893 RepID=A0A9D8KH41_9DELT|nr:glycosyltransferase family 39 protein [Candidatus Zymogenus saltonus]